MRYILRIITAFIIFLSNNLVALSQDKPSSVDHVLQFPENLLGVLSKKTGAIQEKMTKQTARYIHQLQKQEDKLQKKLSRKDSAAAVALFNGSREKYDQLLADLKNDHTDAGPRGNIYSSQLDSLKTTFKYLGQAGVLSLSSGALKKEADARQALNNAQGSLNQTARIDQFLQERQQLLQTKMSQFGLDKAFISFKKQVYYYQELAEGYKQMLENPDAIGAKALDVVKQSPAFQRFFSNHSELAGLFVLPGATDPDVGKDAMVGVQTRKAIQNEIQGKYGKTANVQQMVTKNVRDAQTKIGRQGGALNLPGIPLSLPGRSGSYGQEVAMPEFKPNNQHNRSFMERLEFGINLQTIRTNGYWPATSDIGLSMGYHLSDNNTIGIRGSFNMGWGANWQHMALSAQGAGGGSFLECKDQRKLLVYGRSGVGLQAR